MLVCSIINYFFNDGAMTYINYAKAGQYAENVYWLKAVSYTHLDVYKRQTFARRIMIIMEMLTLIPHALAKNMIMNDIRMDTASMFLSLIHIYGSSYSFCEEIGRWKKNEDYCFIKFNRIDRTVSGL